MSKKAVILVSGGLDSATTLAIAKSQNYDCYALSFDYGQKHTIELQAARRIVQHIGNVIEHKFIYFNLNDIGGSALTDDKINVPTTGLSDDIPITYVPARNTIFLSLALAWAEVLSAYNIFIGVNAVDYSGYPDCRPEFIRTFEKLSNLATKAGIEGKKFNIHTPLADLTKAKIIEIGQNLGVDYSLTISCYQPDSNGKACRVCDSCRLREEGFRNSNMADPTQYK